MPPDAEGRATHGRDQLQRLYREVLPRLLELPRDRGLSAPHFIDPPEEFWTARARIVVVGQQTDGWGTEGKTALHDGEGAGRVEDLMTSHRDFGLGVGLTRTPFWQATNTLSNELATEGAAVTVSNLAKMDQDGKQPDTDIMDRLLEMRILPRELEILRPDHVVFFVGPTRESVLRETFEESAPAWERPVVRFTLPGNVQATWSYHPGYLRRSGKWSVVDGIVQAIRDELEPTRQSAAGG